MTNHNPQLRADAEGVWREDEPGKRSGIRWNEIYAVSGCKLDAVTEIYTGITLDFDYGEFMELYTDWAGFEQVADAISERLPGIEHDWLARIEQLDVTDTALTVWKRDDVT